MDDIQAQLRDLVEEYLGSHLIEEISLRQGLQEVTTLEDENQRYFSTGQLTVTIILVSR